MIEFSSLLKERRRKLLNEVFDIDAKMTEVRIVADTYAWIELFIGSEKGKKEKEVLEKCR